MKKKYIFVKNTDYSSGDIYAMVCTQCAHAIRIEKEQYEEGIKKETK